MGECKYEVGQWVIDTQKDIAGTIACVFPSDWVMTEQLYVMRNDDILEFYIQSEDNIIPYDKYYFDKKEG